MKMRKKTIFVVLAVFFAIALAVIVLRNIPTKAEALFPVPDKIVCFYNGEEYVLKGEQCRRIGEKLAEISPTGENVSSQKLEGELRDHANTETTEFGSFTLAFELRYSFPKKYTGEFDGSEKDAVTFDRIAMLYKSGELLFDYYNNGFKCDLYDDESCHSALNRITMIRFPTILRVMEQCVVDELMDTTLWQATDTEPAASNVFPARPDSVLLHIDGRTAKLKGEELEKMHSALVLACSGGTISHSQGGPAMFGYAIGTVEQAVLVELRYNKRQKFVPDPVAARESNTQALRRQIFPSFLVSSLNKSTLVCALPRENPLKIFSPQGALQSREIDFLQDEPNFLRNMRIFKKNLAKYCGKDTPRDLMCSTSVRLPDEQEYGVAVYRAYADKEYDSLIFAWGGKGDEESDRRGGCDDMHIFLNLDGSYDWWHKNNSHIGVPPEIEATLADIRSRVRV